MKHKKLLLTISSYILWIIFCYFILSAIIYYAFYFNKKYQFTDLLLNWKLILTIFFIASIIYFILIIYKIIARKYHQNLNKLKKATSKLEKINYLNNFSKRETLLNNESGFATNFKMYKLEKNKSLQFNVLNQHHMLVIGTTGIGKSQNIVIPNIIANIFSKDQPHIVVADPKGELIKLTRSFIELTNYKIIELDFINFNKDKWNPFYQTSILWHQNKLDEFEKELDNLVQMLIINIKSNKDPVWHHASLILLKTHIIYLLICDKKLIVNARLIITSFSIGINKLIKKYNFVLTNIVEDQKKIDIFNRNVSIFLDDKNKMLPSIYLMTLTTLQKFSSEKFFKMSNTNKIIALNEPTIIFIKTNPLITTYWSLASLFISSIINNLFILNNKRKALFILDEFGNLPTINDFSNIISISRAYNIYFMLIVQSYDQLEKRYLDYKNILGNINHNLFLHTNDINTAQYFAKQLGTIDFFDLSSINYINKKNSLNYQKNIKPVLDYYELSCLKRNTAILKSAHFNPLEIKLISFYNFSNEILHFLQKNA